MKPSYEIIEKLSFTEQHRTILAGMLKKQEKVPPPYDNKIDRCIFLCIASIDGAAVAIGAIKKRTASVFSQSKADKRALSKAVDWELGYVFTEEAYRRNGIAPKVVSKLIEAIGNCSLMATTEVTANERMVSILESFGFKRYGKSWKSVMHKNDLGLWLKLKNTETY